jgi:3-dehydroquinate dehydratase/shikimate dehydrogenase
MPKQQLCVTVTAPTLAELCRRRDAHPEADLIELRLDSVRDPDAAGAIAGRRRPVIVTCRPKWEGGSFTGSEEERERLLRDALAAGAEYVDIEASAGFGALMAQTGGRRIVLSAHDFTGIPRDLDARVRTMRATGAEVVKIAVSATRLRDCVLLREAGARASQDGPIVLIGMGEHGMLTRILPSRFHSAWSYAGALAGVGQLTPDVLLNDFRFRDLGAGTSLYGVVGSPVSHSVSPAMHNAAFGRASIDAVYLPLPAIDVDDFVDFAKAFAIKGASVTTPYKVALFDRVEATSDTATKIGAINTIRVEGSRWFGENSDVSGFLEPLHDRLPLNAVRASILGAGGAARGVAVGLASQGARVTVHARNAQRAASVAALVSGGVGTWPPERGSWDLLVNSTPVGMYPRVDATPLPADRLGAGTVYDLVYNPPTTRLLREAQRAGCRTIGGLDMLVGQARQQFEWWTGVRPSSDVMREAALKGLAEFTAATDQAPDSARGAFDSPTTGLSAGPSSPR